MNIRHPTESNKMFIVPHPIELRYFFLYSFHGEKGKQTKSDLIKMLQTVGVCYFSINVYIYWGF